jgi:LmbE family N-acetylglucosaminyl deacetylase
MIPPRVYATMNSIGEFVVPDRKPRCDMTDVRIAREVTALPEARSVLAVCAHPDDESFGLGAALAAFVASGSSTSVLCFTHGEASTLGADAPELGRVRAAELADAAAELGVMEIELLHYPDGGLGSEPLDLMTRHIQKVVEHVQADLLLVFDEGGITGHFDHHRATEAGVTAGHELGVPVLAWALPEFVTDELNREFGAGVVGRSTEELDFLVPVDRERQHKAIARHVSQVTDNPVLGRRLQLQGDLEAFRWLSVLLP